MNYFNYFTEIEEHFQRARGRQIYLCPLDWALIESWQQSGIPLPAVLAGIDQTFAAFASGRRRDTERPRSLAYCAAAVMRAAETAKEAAVGGHGAAAPAAEPAGFERGKIAAFLAGAREQIAAAALPPLALAVAAEIAADLAAQAAAWAAPASTPAPSLEELDRWLTALDDRLFAALQSAAPTADLAAARAEYERELAPYRRQLKTEQLAMVERQFLRKRLLERYRLPRLSLFYLS